MMSTENSYCRVAHSATVLQLHSNARCCLTSLDSAMRKTATHGLDALVSGIADLHDVHKRGTMRSAFAQIMHLT